MTNSYIDLSNYGLRIPYDKDGSAIFNRFYSNPYVEMADAQAVKTALNDDDINTYYYSGYSDQNWFSEDIIIFLSQPWDIHYVYYEIRSGGVFQSQATWDVNNWLYFSSNSTNGEDGTWELVEWLDGYPLEDRGEGPKPYLYYGNTSSWRQRIFRVGVSSGPTIAIKQHRVQGPNSYFYFYGLHLYGNIAPGYNDNRLFIMENPNNEKNEVEDLENVMTGTRYIRQLWLMNGSWTKIARNVDVYPEDSKNQTLNIYYGNRMVEVSETSDFSNTNDLDTPVSDSSIYQSASPPPSTEGASSEIGGGTQLQVSVTINQPATIRITGTVNTNFQNASTASRTVSLYRNGNTIVDTKTESGSNTETHTFDITDTIITPGVYTYDYHWWSATQDRGYLFTSGTNTIAVEEIQQRLFYEGIGPREVKTFYIALTPVPGGAPHFIKMNYVPDFFTAEHYVFGQAMAKRED